MSAPLETLLADAEERLSRDHLEITRVMGCAHLPIDPSEPSGSSVIPDPGLMVDVTGAYSFLCRYSKPHDHYQLGLIEGRLLPSLEWDSYRLYFADELPVAFVNWTWVTEEVDFRLSSGESAISPDDWHKGTHMWFMEVLAPFGHSLDMMLDLHNNVFSTDPSAKATFLSENGGIRHLRHYRSMA